MADVIAPPARLAHQIELSSVLENSDDMVFITDDMGTATYFNQAAMTSLHLSTDKSKRPFNIFESIQAFDLSARSPDHYRKLFLSSGFEKDVMLIPVQGGSMVPAHLKSFLISDSDPNCPKRYAFIGRNLKSKIENEVRLQTALDVAQMAIWEYDIETKNHYRTPEHDRLYGFEKNLDQWNNDIFHSTLHPEDEEVVTNYFARLERGEDKNFSIEYRIKWPNGEIRWLSARGRVLMVKGKASRLVGGVTDVTKIKESESDLRAALRSSEKFLSIASHELKTPVTALKLQMQLIRHYLENLDRATELDRQNFEEAFTDSIAQFDHLTELVNNLLGGFASRQPKDQRENKNDQKDKE